MTIDAPPPTPPAALPARLGVAAALYRRPRLQLRALLAAPLGWLRHRLSRVAGAVPDHVVLAARPVQRQHRPGADARQLRGAPRPASSTGRSRSGRSAIAALVTLTDIVLAFPDRVLHGPGGVAATRGAARRVDPAAALVRLSRQGLRVAADPEPRTACSTGSWRRSGSRGRATATSRSGSSCRYLWLPYMIIPIFAGLERIPNSLLEASGGPRRPRPATTFRRVILPLVLPAVVAGSIFTFSLTLGDYITPTLVSSTQFIGNVIVRQRRRRRQPAAGRRLRDRPGHRSCSSTCSSPGASAPSRPSDGQRRAGPGSRCASRPARRSLFIYFPIAIIVLYSFNASQVVAWPITAFTLDWYGDGVRRPGHPGGPDQLARGGDRGDDRRADPRHRSSRSPCSAIRFFGREAISFLVILPLALPGIVTGMALNTAFRTLGFDVRAVHDHRRARHVLHRGHLQQRHRPPPPDVALVRGGLDGPRRRHVADVPARHASRRSGRR